MSSPVKLGASVVLMFVLGLACANSPGETTSSTDVVSEVSTVDVEPVIEQKPGPEDLLQEQLVSQEGYVIRMCGQGANVEADLVMYQMNLKNFYISISK